LHGKEFLFVKIVRKQMYTAGSITPITVIGSTHAHPTIHSPAAQNPIGTNPIVETKPYIPKSMQALNPAYLIFL